MPASAEDQKVVEGRSSAAHTEDHSNAEFGGTETRKALEKRLLLKLDLRMSIMAIIYILYYVRRLLLGRSAAYFPQVDRNNARHEL